MVHGAVGVLAGHGGGEKAFVDREGPERRGHRLDARVDRRGEDGLARHVERESLIRHDPDVFIYVDVVIRRGVDRVVVGGGDEVVPGRRVNLAGDGQVRLTLEGLEGAGEDHVVGAEDPLRIQRRRQVWVLPGEGPVHLFRGTRLGGAGREGEGQVVQLGQELRLPGQVGRDARDLWPECGEGARSCAAHLGGRADDVTGRGREGRRRDGLDGRRSDLLPLDVQRGTRAQRGERASLGGRREVQAQQRQVVGE